MKQIPAALMTDAPTDQSEKISRTELERLEQSFRCELSFRTCSGWLLFAFGCLFAVMSAGCIVQHFVDRDMPWGRNPFQDLFEPIYWGLTSILWFAASRQAIRRKYLWAIGILAAFFVGTAIIIAIVISLSVEPREGGTSLRYSEGRGELHWTQPRPSEYLRDVPPSRVSLSRQVRPPQVRAKTRAEFPKRIVPS